MIKRRLSFCFVYLLFAIYAIFIQKTIEVEIYVLSFCLIPLSFFVLNILNLKVSIVYEYLLAAYLLIGNGFGGILNYYYRLPNLDMYMHMFAGTISASLVLFYIYKYQMNLHLKAKCILIFWGSMGFASIWEMYEFFADEVLGYNMQKREEGIIDTMHDVWIHAFGTICFILLILFDELLNNNRLNKKIEKGLFLFDKPKEVITD